MRKGAASLLGASMAVALLLLLRAARMPRLPLLTGLPGAAGRLLPAIDAKSRPQLFVGAVGVLVLLRWLQRLAVRLWRKHRSRLPSVLPAKIPLLRAASSLGVAGGGLLALTGYRKTSTERARIKASLKDSFLVSNAPADDIEVMIDAMTPQIVRSGDIIYRAGDPRCDYFYVVDEGDFACYAGEPGVGPVARTLEDSGFFGELGILFSQPRKHTVTACSDGRLWKLDAGTFRALLVQGPMAVSATSKELNEETLLDSLDADDLSALVGGVWV